MRYCSSYKGAKPQSCISSAGRACSSYADSKKPSDCFTSGQRRARILTRRAARLAAARAAAKKAAERRAAAKRAAEQRAAARRAAARRAAANKAATRRAAARGYAAWAAANAWHQGYYQQDSNVFWQWRNNNANCQDYAMYGCWHVAVVTRNGCNSYVAVNANEYQGSAIVGNLLANQGYGIPPKTVRVFELDADTGSNVTANDVHIDCE